MFSCPKKAAYHVTWTSDIKSNIINGLPKPENLKISNTRFYFNGLEPTLVSDNVIFVTMAAISGHVITQ